MAFSDYSTTPGSNVSINGINIAENCSPANINNAIRQLMADAKTFADALGDSTDYQPLDASLTALAALVTAANKGLYFTASDTPATYDLTAFGRTLAGLADVAALKSQISAVTVVSSTLAASGHLALDLTGDGAADIKLNWGTGTFGSSVTFQSAFATACWGVVPFPTSAIGQSDESDEHLYVSSTSVSGFVTAISGDYSTAPTLFFLAIGV